MNPSLYDILEVPDNASQDTIKAAYRRLAMKYHPDRNEGDAEAEARFKLVKEAYEVLIDPQQRKEYDETGRVPGSGPTREEQLHEQAIRVFIDAMSRAENPLTTNMVTLMQNMVLQSRNRVLDRRAKVAEAMEKMKHMAGKFSRSDEKPNLLGQHILNEVAKAEEQIKAMTASLADHDDLHEYIGSYSFDPDSPPMFYHPSSNTFTGTTGTVGGNMPWNF